MPDFLKTSVEANVATVWLDRPPVNAVNAQVLAELVEVFSGLGQDDDVHAAVFASTSDKVFCAGADMKGGQERRRTSELDTGRPMRAALEAVLHCAVPVVAAVNGPALGSGLGLVSMCDIIVASEQAAFGLPEVGVGMLGGGAHLQRMIGPHRMRELFFTARRISAVELAAMGAISRVVPHEHLMSEALDIAGQIAAMDPVVVRVGKESLNRVESLPVMDAYRIEQDYTARLRASRRESSE